MLADNALTTLDRMKLMLGLSDIEDERTNEIVTLLINKASSWIERQIGRHLGRHSYHQWYDADGQQELVLLEYPIISVEYVKQEGKIVDPETYDYAQTGEIGVIYRDKGWLKAGYRRGLAYDIVAPMRSSRLATRLVMSCRKMLQLMTLRPYLRTLKGCYGIWCRKSTPTCRTALRACLRSPSRT